MAISSKKELSGIALSLTATVTLIFLSVLCVVAAAAAPTNTLESELLNSPHSVFAGTAQTVADLLKDVTSLVSALNGYGFADSRLSKAVSDCLHMIDMSSDALHWSLSAIQTSQGKHRNVGKVSSDLRTWLSAALANQDTCMQGLNEDDSNSTTKGLVTSGLRQVMTLLKQLLSQVNHVAHDHTTFSSTPGHFPSWVKPVHKKFLHAEGVQVDAVVAADGSGNYTKVMDAVLNAPDFSAKRYVIHVKKGVYYEQVDISKKKSNVMMIGDGIGVTVISGDLNYVDGITPLKSATFGVSGQGFIARDITFENTAGPEKHQAVALRSDSDQSVFYRCEISGYQATLFASTMRQFYKECKISGTVDIIFGDAAAVFQNCHIKTKQGLPEHMNTITAQGRNHPYEPTGFSFQFCNISADRDLVKSLDSPDTFLGRPMRLYSRTVFMQSYISDVVRPEGWSPWAGRFAFDTLYYAEYENYGPGASVAHRVKWPGYHVLNRSRQASEFTVAKFIRGNLWLPSTGVKFIAGLRASN